MAFSLELVAFLKWACYFGITVRWNFASIGPGWPGLGKLLPALTHLPPAETAANTRLSPFVEAWRRAWSRPFPPALEIRRGVGFLELTDTRATQGRWETARLEGAQARAYLQMQDPTTEDELLASAGAENQPISHGNLARWLSAWRARGWVLGKNGAHVALALPYRRDRPAGLGWLKLYRARAI